MCLFDVVVFDIMHTLHQLQRIDTTTAMPTLSQLRQLDSKDGQVQQSGVSRPTKRAKVQSMRNLIFVGVCESVSRTGGVSTAHVMWPMIHLIVCLACSEVNTADNDLVAANNDLGTP